MNKDTEKMFYKKTETMKKTIVQNLERLEYRAVSLQSDEMHFVYTFEYDTEILRKIFEGSPIKVSAHREIVNDTDYLKIRHQNTVIFAYNIVPERCVIKVVNTTGAWIDVILQHELRSLGFISMRITDDGLIVKTYMS